jgi:hypothetical protein
VRQVVELLEDGKAELRNAYPRAVSAEGNTVAQQALADVFTVTDRQWRGIGMIPRSGWTLSPRYAAFDAELKFGVGHLQVEESAECHSGACCRACRSPTSARRSARAAHRAPAGRHDGLQRGRLRRVLPVPAAGDGGRCLDGGAGAKRPRDRQCRTRRTGSARPLRETKRIALGHGGGILSEELIENLFLPAFGPSGGGLRPALLAVGAGQIALTTDSYVVNPLFFPGGNTATWRSTAPSTTWPAAGAAAGAHRPLHPRGGLELEVLGTVAQTIRPRRRRGRHRHRRHQGGRKGGADGL